MWQLVIVTLQQYHNIRENFVKIARKVHQAPLNLTQTLRRWRRVAEEAGGEAGIGEEEREVWAAEPDGPDGEERLRRSVVDILEGESEKLSIQNNNTKVFILYLYQFSMYAGERITKW